VVCACAKAHRAAAASVTGILLFTRVTSRSGI
jgi:hypothetical protein